MSLLLFEVLFGHFAFFLEHRKENHFSVCCNFCPWCLHCLCSLCPLLTCLKFSHSNNSLKMPPQEQWGSWSSLAGCPLCASVVWADPFSDKLLSSPMYVVGFEKKSPDECCVLSNTPEQKINGRDNTFSCPTHTSHVFLS